MARDPDIAKLVVEMAYLCDSMKRLEKAIETDSASDRRFYLREAKERRERVEKKLEAMAKAPGYVVRGTPPFNKEPAPPHDHVWTDDPKAPPNGFRVCSVCGVSSKGMAE